MRRSAFRLYGPFVAIVVVQALLIMVAPSNAPDRTNTFARRRRPLPGRRTRDRHDPSPTPRATDRRGRSGHRPARRRRHGGGGAASTAATGQPLPAGAGDPAAGAGGADAAAGDTSHCVGDRQFDVLINDPPCIPRFDGDNGGATYPGVTADSDARSCCSRPQPNEAVNAVLAPQGLAATEQERRHLRRVAGVHRGALRAVRPRHRAHPLPGRLPDDAAGRARVPRGGPRGRAHAAVHGRVRHAALRPGLRRVRPGRDHLRSAAGTSTTCYFTAEGRRGLRYDLFMDGTRSAEMIAEYYCKKLAGGTADRGRRRDPPDHRRPRHDPSPPRDQRPGDRRQRAHRRAPRRPRAAVRPRRRSRR